MTKSVCLICTMFLFGVSVKAQLLQQKAETETFRSPFRYVIIGNKYEPPLNRKDAPRRVVEVLMDGKSFSKKNLVALLKRVSERFAKPKLLYVNVYTSLEDVETPEERERNKFSDVDPAPNAPNRSDLAVFIRTNERSFFYIYYSNGDFDEVELK